jgi:hypothetical protein
MLVARKLLLLLMIVGVAACAQGSSDREADVRPAQKLQLGPSLDWPPVEGAVEYRVQVWDGLRLLFEETREQPRLQVTPTMRRSLRGVRQAEIRVQALGADGQAVGAVHVRTLVGHGD